MGGDELEVRLKYLEYCFGIIKIIKLEENEICYFFDFLVEYFVSFYLVDIY